MIVQPKICISGAIGSNRNYVAMMLSEITGLPLLNWLQVELIQYPDLLRGIVFDVGSQERVDKARENGFVIIQYVNETCDKRINIDYEDDDLLVTWKTGQSTRQLYDQLVHLFERDLVIRTEAPLITAEDDTDEDPE